MQRLNSLAAVSPNERRQQRVSKLSVQRQQFFGLSPSTCLGLITGPVSDCLDRLIEDEQVKVKQMLGRRA